MKKLTLLGASMALVLSGLANADNSASGCGLGAEILEGKSGKGSHIAAAILNGLVIPNTTFMTTGGGIMGCDPTETVSNEQATEIFVASNLDQISSEAAQGGGDYLDVLAQMLGIDDADRSEFHALAQQNYDALFSGGDAGDMLQSLQTAMLADDTLSKYAVN